MRPLRMIRALNLGSLSLAEGYQLLELSDTHFGPPRSMRGQKCENQAQLIRLPQVVITIIASLATCVVCNQMPKISSFD